MPSVRLPIVLCVVLVLAAGCVGVPEPPASTERDASFSATNDGNETAVVTVSVVSGQPVGYRVTDAGNVTRTYRNATTVDDLPPRAVATAVSLVPIGEDVRTERYTLRVGEGVGTTFDSVGRNVTLVTVVAYPENPEPMRTIGVGSCGPDATLTAVEILIQQGGLIHESVSCEG